MNQKWVYKFIQSLTGSERAADYETESEADRQQCRAPDQKIE